MKSAYFVVYLALCLSLINCKKVQSLGNPQVAKINSPGLSNAFPPFLERIKENTYTEFTLGKSSGIVIDSMIERKAVAGSLTVKFAQYYYAANDEEKDRNKVGIWELTVDSQGVLSARTNEGDCYFTIDDAGVRLREATIKENCSLEKLSGCYNINKGEKEAKEEHFSSDSTEYEFHPDLGIIRYTYIHKRGDSELKDEFILSGVKLDGDSTWTYFYQH